jgi:membrane protease YdiL (CAAX protease family)
MDHGTAPATTTTGTTPARADLDVQGATWVERHQLGAFVLLAYALSWPLFALAALGAGDLLVVAGAFGPALAAAVVVRRSRRSARQWWRQRWTWRLPARFYAFALGLPPLLIGVTAAELVLMGEPVRAGAVSTLLPRHAVTVVVVALLGGGQEEPGWRGFALERLQSRRSPLVATIELGVIWGAWHLPVYGLGGFAGPVLLIVFYTWLYNRTRSVPLCVLLHASFNTSVAYLDLPNASATAIAAFIVTAAVSAAAMVLVTRGRLGFTRGAGVT